MTPTTTQPTPQETVTNRRQEYMSGKLSHQEYYLWLCSFIGLTEAVIEHLRKKILASTDPHFNDIPLAHWDALSQYIRPLASRKRLSWSLSDSVCCAKALARKLATLEVT